MVQGLVMIFLSIALGLGQDGTASMSAVGPIVVEDDTANRIVSSHPGEASVAVAGDTGLYSYVNDEWTKVAPAPPAGQIVSSGGDEPILLAGDHAPCLRGGASFDLHRSEDAGMTWELVPGVTDFRPLAIWPEEGVALASSCVGIQVSLDGGLAWSPIPGIELGWEITSFAEVPQSDGSGPHVLVGLTGEGGTSYLRSIDFTDPAAPVVSDDLRMYFATGGLAGIDDTYLLAVMDGVWKSTDRGVTWERSRDGLEDVTLERDPLVDGLPLDMPPNVYGLFAAALVPGESMDVYVGSTDGLYGWSLEGDEWSSIGGTSGQVNDIVVSGDGGLVVYETDEGVFHFTTEPGS